MDKNCYYITYEYVIWKMNNLCKDTFCDEPEDNILLGLFESSQNDLKIFRSLARMTFSISKTNDHSEKSSHTYTSPLTHIALTFSEADVIQFRKYARPSLA